MRKIIHLIKVVILLVLSFPLHSQNNSIKWKYFKNFTEEQKIIIKDNWQQFYKEDILSKLDPNVLSFPLKLDSYGSFYPDSALFNFTTNDCFSNGFSDKIQNKYSIYEFLKNKKLNKQARENLARIKDNKLRTFYDSILNTVNHKEYKLEPFYDLWDRFHSSLVLNRLNEVIKNNNITSILFFAHGYNVPYSLAVVQAIEVYKKQIAYDKKSKVLLVPIFWPSNNQKECELSNEESFTIDNKKKIFNGGIKTGTDMWYYSNQAYYASLALRKTINSLKNENLNLYVFSHSLGTTIATSAFINTFSKLDGLSQIEIKSISDSMDTNEKERLQRKAPITFDIVLQMKKTDIPDLPVKIFLSAAAIPGEATFTDMRKSLIENKQFFSTINKYDPIINKNLTGNIKILNAGSFSETTLGCDFNNDCERTKTVFRKHGLESNIVFGNVEVPDHDLFVYLSNDKYDKFLKNYFTSDIKNNNDLINLIVNDTTKKSARELFDSLSGIINSSKYNAFFENRTNNSPERKFFDRASSHQIQTLTNVIKDLLFDTERTNEFSEIVLPATRTIIEKQNNAYELTLIKREVIEDLNNFNSDFLKRKIESLVDDRLYHLSQKYYPHYKYRTKKASFIKFFSISSGNDLFTPAGLSATIFDLDIKNSKWYFQRNDDRDYTGSLLIEIGTDYFRFPRRRNLKTYQTIFYGFDVFTPYFKDTTIFAKSDTFNVNDRPHASFQYFGWSKKGLSRNDGYRWSIAFKFGKIGGDNGRNFQAALHQDVSYSPRPKGWDSQISNKGRIGFSFEGAHDWLLNKKEFKKENSFWNYRFYFISNWKVGSYMTNLSAGLQYSNKNFKQCNHNLICKRQRQNIVRWTDYLMYSFSFVATGVKHNTMLQGYGVFDTKEYRDDAQTPGSRHKLTQSQVKPLVYTLSIDLSYTAKFFTVFYRWMSISPETTIDDTKARRNYYDKNLKKNVLSTETMKIGNRWHHFATIGLAFNLFD